MEESTFEGFVRWGVSSAGDVAQVVEVSPFKLEQWVRLGAVVPLVASKGTGTARGYGFKELVRAALCRELEGLGIAPRQLARFTRPWAGSLSRSEEGSSLPLFVAFFDEGGDDLRVSLVYDDARLVALLGKQAEPLLVLPYRRFVQKVRARAEKLWRDRVKPYAGGDAR